MLSVAVMGAGCVGAWLGGRLAAAGHPVILIGRDALREQVERGGLTAVDLAGREHEGPVTVTLDPAGARGADVVLVTVKGRDTAAAGLALAPHLDPDTVVVSFQNGLRNPDRLKRALPDHLVAAGMVSFNIARQDRGPHGGARFQQGTSGPVALVADPRTAPLAAALRAAGLDVHEAPDMHRVQWAKLLLNLNNAVNALSGLPLREQLADRGYRRVLAASMDEAWAVLRAAGVQPAPIGRMRPRLAPRVLPLPDPLFRLLAAPMIRVDPAARSSMADDLARGRATEIDDINGEVVALGRAHDLPTPVNQRLVELVHLCEEGRRVPGMPAEELWPPAT